MDAIDTLVGELVCLEVGRTTSGSEFFENAVRKIAIGLWDLCSRWARLRCSFRALLPTLSFSSVPSRSFSPFQRRVSSQSRGTGWRKDGASFMVTVIRRLTLLFAADGWPRAAFDRSVTEAFVFGIVWRGLAKLSHSFPRYTIDVNYRVDWFFSTFWILACFSCLFLLFLPRCNGRHYEVNFNEASRPTSSRLSNGALLLACWPETVAYEPQP